MFNYFSSCQGIDIASTNVSRYEKEDSGGVSLVNCALCTILMALTQEGQWAKERTYPPNPHPLLMMAMSHDEHFVIGTFMTGFQLWQVMDDNKQEMCQVTTLKLPSGMGKTTYLDIELIS